MVAAMSCVRVAAIDCTAMGLLPPMRDVADADLACLFSVSSVGVTKRWFERFPAGTAAGRGATEFVSSVPSA